MGRREARDGVCVLRGALPLAAGCGWSCEERPVGEATVVALRGHTAAGRRMGAVAMEMVGSKSILKSKPIDWLMGKMWGKGSERNQRCPPGQHWSDGCLRWCHLRGREGLRRWIKSSSRALAAAALNGRQLSAATPCVQLPGASYTQTSLAVNLETPPHTLILRLLLLPPLFYALSALRTSRTILFSSSFS